MSELSPPPQGGGGQFPALPLRVGSDLASLTGASLMGPTQPVREATPSRGPPVGGREGGQDP